MKNLIKVIIISILVLSTFSLVIAKDSPKMFRGITFEQAEQSLFMGLNSGNLGLMISSSYMLGEIKSKSAIPKLTEFINKVDNDKARLTAILALLKIASSESNVALNQNDRSSEISELCEKLMSCHSCLTEIFNPQNVREELSAVSE